MTEDDFRRMALGFEGAVGSSHMGAADFRVGGHIFATLAHVEKGYGNLMLTPELQAILIDNHPDQFVPVAGGWGRNGATHIRLAEADPEAMEAALRMAWELRVDKNVRFRKRK